MRSAKKVLIMDARSYAAAFGNRARGGGMECNEYYKDCEVEFMNMANIHEIRKCFHRLRALLASTPDQSAWFSGLEATKWIFNLSCLLSSAVRCARALEAEGRPVVVHCSDGWDRTSQISSLAQLILDPYYRTMEGFEVLVEREWLAFGHKMADRNGGPFCAPEPNERCPIFLQWLDCVHQLLFQFPCAFQFNFAYLIKLARHVYSNLFGNFLFNSDRERREHGVRGRTRSIWTFLRYHAPKYYNYLYQADRDAASIWPKTDARVLQLWQEVYSDFSGRGQLDAPADSAPEGLNPPAAGAVTNGEGGNGSDVDGDGGTPPAETSSSSPGSAESSSSSRAAAAGVVFTDVLAAAASAASAAASTMSDNLSSSAAAATAAAAGEESRVLPPPESREDPSAGGAGNGESGSEEIRLQQVISSSAKKSSGDEGEGVELKEFKRSKVSHCMPLGWGETKV